MASRLLFLGILIILIGCRSNQREYLDSLKSPDLTRKEEIFIKKLESEGFYNLKIEVPIIGYSAYGSSTYYIWMTTPFNLTNLNIDSVASVRQSIAKEMYRSVIADSVIYDCREIDIIFNYPNREVNPYKYEQLSGDIFKDSLEQWCGFQVVKDRKGGYKRVPLK